MLDVFFVSGQKRSGNHLIINWLMSCYKNPIFINDINPFDCSNIPYIEGEIKKITTQQKDCVIISYEMPHLLIHDKIIDLIKNNINYNNLYCPFIMRDPINCFFSCIILYLKNKKLIENEANLISIIKENKKNIWDKMLINIPLWQQSSFPVNYNNFVKDIEYRKDICKKINKEFNKENDFKIMNTLWEIPAVSFASSFDSEKIKNNKINPSSMKVLERYKKYLHLINEIEIPESIKNFTNKYFPEININIKIW